MSVIARDANATARQTLSSFYNNTAPNPNEDAFAEILVSAAGL